METIYFEVNIPKILATKLLAKVFPKIYYTPLSPVQFAKVQDQPLPGPRWVRVKNVMTGICGADLSMFFVQASPSISLAAMPGVPKAFMGHELVGSVVETGGEVDTLATGDRVVLQRYLPCCSMKEINPPCEPCRHGNYTLCENFSEGSLPQNLGAGFGDHFIAHESQLLKVPDSLPDESAVLIEPAAVSLHAVLRRPPQPKEKVLVIGAGVIGLNVIQFIKAIEPNCHLFLLEKIMFKNELGLRLGADEILIGDPYDAVRKATGANLYRGPLNNNNLMGGFDVIYDCVGYSKTIHDSLRWIKARGDYVMVGNQLSPVSFDQTPVWQQEVGIIGVNAHGMETYQGSQISSFDLAIKMILDGKINLNGFITHRFPLKKYKTAFKLFRDKKENVIKVVFEME